MAGSNINSINNGNGNGNEKKYQQYPYSHQQSVFIELY